MGKGWYQTQVTPSARACSFAVPYSGEPYTSFGFIKAHNHRFKQEESMALALTKTKCASSKTQELLDFIRYNERILRFKNRTIRNIDEATKKGVSANTV